MIYKRYKQGIYDVDDYGDHIIYRLHGTIHNEHGPAIIYKNGKKLFYLEGIEFIDKQEYDKYLRKQKLKKLLNYFKINI